MAMKGVKNFSWNTEPLMRKAEKGMDQAVAKLAFQAQRKIKLLISKQFPPSSKPGEPPRFRTRQLLQSIMAEKLGPRHWQVGSPLNYAFWLEFGTFKMEARPFLRPALTWIKQSAPKVVVTEVTRAA